MKAKHDNRQSWEKQQYWKLDNGWTAIVEFSPHYGDYITQLYNKDVKWQACNGLKDLPDFAKDWVTPISPGHWQTLVRTNFEKDWN